MTATTNTGAESIRLAGKHLPLLLRLRTTGTAGFDGGANEALHRLEAAGLVRHGSLDPMTDAILESIAGPGLVVSVERMRGGDVAAATIWGTSNGATIGTRIGCDLYELRLTDPDLLPSHLFQLLHLRSLPPGAAFQATVPAAILATAEEHLSRGRADLAHNALEDSGCADSQQLAELLTAREASWRIESVWSVRGGAKTAIASGMDCGRRGHVLVDVGPGAEMTLRTAGFAEVVRAVRGTLPV